LVQAMEKLPSGNSVCEKSWSRSHSKYGMCLHVH